MTVLLVHPGAELFGSDRMFLESASAMVDETERVVAVLPGDGPLVGALRDAGVDVVIVPLLVLRKALMRPRGWPILVRDFFRGARAAARLIRRLRPRAVYVSTITLPTWPVLARVLGVPRVVSHVHEAEGSGNRLVNAALYVPHLASQRVLVNSAFARETIRRSLARLTSRCEIVYNGVAAPANPVPPRTEVSGAFRLTYLGRLSPRKGPDLLLDAAEQFAADGVSTVVTIVGSPFTGYEWYESELRARAAELPPEVTVAFTGFQPDVWPRLAASDVLVVPSRLDEPFGNTAVEGILALRPVVASDTSGLREAAGGYPTSRLFTPGDGADLFGKLDELRRDWHEVIAQVGPAAALARERHSPLTYRETVRNNLARQ